MANCNPTIDPFLSIDGTLKVGDKYAELMTASMADESLYMRMKDTMYQQFKDLQLTEKEKAGMITDFMTKFSVDLTKHAMSQALTWSKEERDGAYTLAKIKADTENSLAQFELIKAQVCETIKKEEMVCVQTMKISADSIRANGYVMEYEADGCKVKLLDETGLVYNQTKQVQGATYQTFADAFRKSGVVNIGIDLQDNVYKGLSGNEDGYTWQQQRNAERQRLAYNDSMKNHAANSSASMIGQMLSAEIAPNEADVQRWRDAVDYLNTPYGV